VKKSYGSQQYPVEYTYDAQGRMKTMVTTGAAGNATTTWNYDSQRGWLVSKLDHANKGPSYTYTAAGRLETRIWARGIETEYTYNTAGDLSAIDYSDATPDVSGITYDVQGRRTSVTDGGGTRTFTYAGGNQLATEANTTLGWAVTRTYDAQNRRASLAATLQPDTLTYIYSSTTGRLETLTQGDYEWTYGWNEPLGTIATTTAKKNSNLILTATKTFDGHGRLTSIVNTDKNAAVFTSHAYTYDTLGRRTQAQREDTTYWDYTYDQYGQVTSGVKKRSDSTPIPGYQFGYTFDSIGNRTETNTNGRTEEYTPNLLNQYTSKENQGIIDVTGTATTASIVTVNEQSTTRLGEYFAGTASGDNSTSAIEITANIHAVNPGAGPNGEDVVSTATKSEIVPPEEEAFTHDDDGNLTADGKWTYTWDAENRLIAITPKSGNEALIGKKLTFGYDTDAKRIWQDTADWNEGTSSWDTPIRERHIYDGWNLLIIADGTLTTASKYFTWGYDLSNSLRRAGGIGGLLVSRVESGNVFPIYDGSGNSIALIDDISNLIGKYEYGPFGQLLSISHAKLLEHPFRWATKFSFLNGEFYGYSHRFFHPRQGRWLNRDPLSEIGGLNLYGYTNNSPINLQDFLGLWVIKFEGGDWEGAQKEYVNSLMKEITIELDRMIARVDELILSAEKMDDACCIKKTLLRDLKSWRRNLLVPMRNGMTSRNLVLRLRLYEADDGNNAGIVDNDIVGFFFGHSYITLRYIRLNKGSFFDPDADAVTTLFHEITHIYGTSDSDGETAASMLWNAHKVAGWLGMPKFELLSYYSQLKEEVKPLGCPEEKMRWP